MDLALMSGNRTEDQVERYPDLLQNWGPSRDVGNIDMPGRIHGAVASLSGNGPGGGPDFLSATIDPNYSALTTEEAVNCHIDQVSGIISDPADTTLNFLALENQEDGTILLLVSNESGEQLEPGRGISFPSRFNGSYSMNVVDGFIPEQGSSSQLPLGFDTESLVSGTLTLDFSGMPPVTASLIELSTENMEEEGQIFLQAWLSGGSSWVRFRAPEGQPSELALYDMTGRRLSTLWTGVGQPDFTEMALQRNGLPAGLYFVTLTSEEEFLPEKVILLR